MKIGLILEGDRGGLDEQICRHTAGRLAPDMELDPVPLGNKPNLMKECGSASQKLLSASRCDRVLIVWDVAPSWGRGVDPERDKENILKSLEVHGLAGQVNKSIFLIGITQELETWLLYDERAIRKVLERIIPPHLVEHFTVPSHPERVDNPKGWLRKLFRQHGRRYDEFRNGLGIAQSIKNLQRVRRCPSFCRFAEKLTGQPFDEITCQV